MSDFYYARYEHLSHRELYDTVRAGDPNTLDQVATRWFTMGNTAGSLSSDLQRDLAALGHTWHGSAGAEFQRRLLSVAQFSDTLAAEFDGLHSNAKYLASRLREAQSKAEDPAATDDNDKMASGAMNGAAIGSVAGPAGTLVGGIVGAFDGHSQDEAEKEKAHKRMIALVADLAADYAYAGTTMSPDQLAAAPPDLPAGTSGPGSGLHHAPGGTTAHGVSTVGHAGPGTHVGLDTTHTVHSGPGTGSGAGTGPGTGSGVDGESGLTGVGGLTGVDGVTGIGAPPGVGVSPGNGTTLGGVGLLGGAGGLAAGGLAISTRGTLSPANASGGAGASVAPRPGPAADAVLGRETDSRSVTAVRNGGPGGRSGPVTAAGRPGEDEPDERTTWLTEDNMDWGGDDAPPPILGERSRDEDSGASPDSHSV